MIRLIILIATGYLLWYGWQQYQKLPPNKRRGALLRWGSIGLAVAAVFLAATGRLHWVGAAFAAAIPILGKLFSVLIRLVPMLGAWRRARGNREPSRIRTRGLEIRIDFRSGQISGQVLAGPHTGRQLAELNEAQLREQLAYFREHDRQSALLLNAYLRQMGRATGDSDYGPQDRTAGGAGMTREEALQILGLAEGASRDDIQLAHKRLIQKLHPDRGGNDYLAAKVNQARDTLIK